MIATSREYRHPHAWPVAEICLVAFCVAVLAVCVTR